MHRPSIFSYRITHAKFVKCRGINFVIEHVINTTGEIQTDIAVQRLNVI